MHTAFFIGVSGLVLYFSHNCFWFVNNVMQPWWRGVAISYAIIMNFGSQLVQNWNNSVWGWLLNIYSCQIISTGRLLDKRMHVIYLFHKLSAALKYSWCFNFILRRKETRWWGACNHFCVLMLHYQHLSESLISLAQKREIERENRWYIHFTLQFAESLFESSKISAYQFWVIRVKMRQFCLSLLLSNVKSSFAKQITPFLTIKTAN